MEGHLCGYDIVFVRTIFLDAVFSRHLDHCLVGLGTGVLEEDLVHADGGTDLFRQQSLWHGVRIIESMNNILCLILNCCNHLFITVTGTVYGDTCIKIQVRCPVFVIHIHILCRLCNKIKTLICLDHVFIYFFLQLLLGKSCVL